jgi:N-methylhydantoinase A/oxoprolinase/acetone carboxylase beta subunit
LLDTGWDRPQALIPRKLRKGVTERVNWQGDIIIPLNENEVIEAIDFLKGQGVVSYAVSFLFSF